MEESYDVYAIVRAGGRQEKVAVGDVLLIDKVDNGEAGATLTLPVLLLVDGDAVTTDAAKLAKVTVSAEAVSYTHLQDTLVLADEPEADDIEVGAADADVLT